MRVKKVYLLLIQFLIIILLISLLFTKSTAIFAVIFALSASILINIYWYRRTRGK